jgi:hypothetical protein
MAFRKARRMSMAQKSLLRSFLKQMKFVLIARAFNESKTMLKTNLESMGKMGMRKMIINK